MVTYKIQLPTKRQKRAERKENVLWTFLAKEPAGARETRVNDSSENPFKPALILAGLKDCNEWHDPKGKRPKSYFIRRIIRLIFLYHFQLRSITVLLLVNTIYIYLQECFFHFLAN